MDLGTIQSQLADFATFGKNIGTALGGIPTALNNIIDFFEGFGAASDVTSSVVKASSK